MEQTALKGKITFLPSIDGTTIEIYDDTSSVRFATIFLSNDNFVAMMARQARVECDLIVKDLHKVGKTLQHMTFEFEINREMQHSKGALHQAALKAIKAKGLDGWIPDQSYSSQNTFFEKDGVYYARTIIITWI